MASFVPIDSVEVIKAYRPNVSALDNPRAWWRYSILAEAYKVRCQQREEKWRIAGNKSMNILAHIRLLISANGNSLDIDFSEVDEDFMNTTASRVVALETVVDQLNRDNMMLRKMLKALLTPIAKENLINDAESLSYIEEQIAQFDNYTAAMTTMEEASNNIHTKIIYESNELIEAEEIENQLQDEMISTLANSIETPDINLRSPYENVLPPIEMTENDFQELPKAGKIFGKKSKSPLKSSQTLNNSTSPNKTEKNPSYLEKEAIKKETKKKKKEQMIMMKAELLLRESTVDNEIKPTMYLPVLKNKPEKYIEPNSARSQESINNNNPSVQTATTISCKQISSKNPTKQLQSQKQQPEWNDNYRVVDSLKGRGKGKPKEDNIAKNDNKTQHTNKKNDNKNQENINNIKERNDNSSPKNDSNNNNNNNNNILFEKERTNMPESEKITRELISKARNMLLKPEEIQKPLTNMELKLLNSPLALPVMKQNSATSMSATSPRISSNKTQLSSSTISISPRSYKEVSNKTHSSKKSPGIKPTQSSPRNMGFIHSPRKDGETIQKNNYNLSPDVSNKSASVAAVSPYKATIDSNSSPISDQIINNSIDSGSNSGSSSSLSEKERKRHVLRSLNEKSNPSSPRKERDDEIIVDQQCSPTDHTTTIDTTATTTSTTTNSTTNNHKQQSQQPPPQEEVVGIVVEDIKQ